MARRDRLFEIAQTHDIPIITIAELIRYRRRHEKLVQRIASARLPTDHGEFKIYAYNVSYEKQEPVALVMGDLSRAKAPLVRMHSSCFTGDLLDSLRCECGDQLHLALDMIRRDGVGALRLPCRKRGEASDLRPRSKPTLFKTVGSTPSKQITRSAIVPTFATTAFGIQILKDLGLKNVRLLTNNPKKSDAFIYYGYELTVVDQVPIIAPPNDNRAKYLQTKRDKMGHNLPPEVTGE